ncbi:MAG TPA: hypothetical protein G4N92_04455 [Anaerolineae bacterium]|nr:hypothetical protein [Anaerolineae bacterium]
MNRKQKITLLVLVVIGIIYFVIFIEPNSSSQKDGGPYSLFSIDEFIIYPNVMRMLTFGKDIHETWGNLIIYQDYLYGYPFYFLSMLVLLPRRLMMGAAFFDSEPTNILILRQCINVVPMILSAGVLVFIRTKFRSIFHSVILFALILTIPSVFRSNIWWFHPDSLTFLFITLTLLFLQLDKLRLGRNFIFAAIACGISIAIKLLGLFFFLTIPLYLLIGLIKKQCDFKKVMYFAIIFVLIMVFVVVFTNPFLWYEGPRMRMIERQASKQYELKHGYTHGDPIVYQRGPKWWEWTFETWFGPPYYLIFLAISLVAGCLWGKDRLSNILIMSWSFPFLIYVLFFVAPKPDNYISPGLIPLYTAALNFPDILFTHYLQKEKWGKVFYLVIMSLVALLLIMQFQFNITHDIPVYKQYLIQVR